MNLTKNKTITFGAVLLVCLTGFAGLNVVTENADATLYEYSAISAGKIDLSPSPGDIIHITDVSSVNSCPYAVLDTATHVATVTIPQMSEGNCSTYDSYVIGATNGGRCWLELHTNQNWPTGRLTDYFYQHTDPIYVTNGTVVSFTATHDDTDGESYYLDYEKVTYVTPGMGLTLDSQGNLNGTVSAQGGSTIYIDWATHYDFVEDGITDYNGRLTLSVTSPEQSHTVTYSANGGSGSVSNTVVTDTNSGNTNVTLAANGFTKAGYTFIGWKVGNTTYQPGQSVPVGANATVTATAQWSQNTLSASANNLSCVSKLTYTNQIGASANNGADLSFSVKSCTGGTASVNESGLVTYKAPTVTSTSSYTVTVTVTATFGDGQTMSKDVSFSVSVDPVLSFTNAATSGTLSVKGA